MDLRTKAEIGLKQEDILKGCQGESIDSECTCGMNELKEKQMKIDKLLQDIADKEAKIRKLASSSSSEN